MSDKTSILIVDQDPATLQEACTILNNHAPFTVILEARNGQEAVTAASTSKPDIIIIRNRKPYVNGEKDNKKSQIDGIQITRSILTAVSSLRILMVCDDNTTIQAAFEAGVLAYVLTDEVQTELMSAIEQLLLERTFFSAAAIRILRVRYQGRPYPSEFPDLTAREVQIVKLLAEGKMNKDVGVELNISERTVENTRATIMEKLKLRNFSDLVRYAVRKGIIEA